MRKSVILCAVALLLGTAGLKAQHVAWSVDFATVFNNREGGNEQTPDQTFFFTKVAPEVGIEGKWGGMKHTVKGGVAWYQPVNDQGRGYKVLPTVYYRLDSKQWTVAFGAFPRVMARELPKFMWSDSLNYSQPNIRGALANYHNHNGFVEMFLDWRQLQSRTKREAFNFDVSTEWNFSSPHFLLGANVQYSHLAKSSNPDVDEGVNDDFMAYPYVGLQWNERRWRKAPSFRVTAGAVLARERARVDDKWINHQGFVATARAKYKRIDVREEFYAGKDLMPLYPRFGSLLNLGDPYYRSKVYSRTDVNFAIVDNSIINFTASLNLHVTDETVGFWQQLSLRMYIDNNLWSKRGKHGQLLKSGKGSVFNPYL